eukprot:gnl/MRDRNA2_/MRDRNA2_89214_c0_seq1.p1 gnl/MRDRNA2_/MRDRNA2_89214_c0~~gnl/MRDRNA2_/MRDRNA2_89214_c0_seq1.p1  ORF type:complete len:358 (+),score=89.47 gnl/MRDRNA2_/MRDRNA2_89214_c0_seq1:165-1238(+)
MERSASEPGLLSGRGSKSSSSQAQSRFESKIMYKRMEQDADLLQNRINLLRQEELKMQKKTQDEKRQIKKILEQRSEHENRSRDHENLEKIKQQELQEMREQNAKKNHQHKKILMQVGKAMMNQKRECHKMMMDEKQDLALKARIQRESELMFKEAQRNHIRSAEILQARRRQKAQQEKEMGAMQRMEDRESAQRQAAREKEDLISQMEREEVELIQRLEKAQERQKVVHAQLEDLLHPGAQPAAPSGLPRAPASGRLGVMGDSNVQRSDKGMARTPSCGALLSRGSSCGAISRTPSRGSIGPHARAGCRAWTPEVLPSGSRASTPPDQKATYTTVNGVTIDVGPEEDLDLFNLLNN